MRDARVTTAAWLIGIAAAARLLPLSGLHPIVWDEVSGKPAEKPAVEEESSALTAVPSIN